MAIAIFIRTPARPALVLLLACGVGCTSVFETSQSDLGLLAPRAELQTIRTLPLREVEQLGDAAVAAEPPPELPRAVVIDASEPSVPISIEAARAAALENNLAVRVALISPSIAAEQVSREEAAFEAVFRVTGVAQDTDTPTSTTLADAQQTFRSLNPSLTLPTRLGGNVAVTAPFTRNSTSNVFATLNPSFTQDLEFSLSQPLLRGAGRRSTTAALRIAAYDQQIAEARTKLDVITQLSAVDRAYWRLYAARQEIEVRVRQRDLAILQLERAERLLNAGSVSEIEVLRAESGVADQAEAIIRAENTAATRERELKRLLNIPGLDVESETAVALESTPDPALYDFDPDAMLTTAMATRMELLEAELQLSQDLVRIDLAENQSLPQLNLDALYRINGLGGTFGEAVEEAAANRFEDWRVGVTAVVPIGNEAALSNLRRAVLSRLQRLATTAGREQTIRQEVLDAIDNLTTSWQRILAARERVALSTRTLRAEERQFAVGRSTSTDVLDASTRLADAQLSELSALVDYQIAQVDLASATGTLLGQARVGLEFAPRPTLDGSRYTPRATGPASEPVEGARLSRPPTPAEELAGERGRQTRPVGH
ncbi:MAG: TolC family protein [Planctomycetota bacterium]